MSASASGSGSAASQIILPLQWSWTLDMRSFGSRIRLTFSTKAVSLCEESQRSSGDTLNSAQKHIKQPSKICGEWRRQQKDSPWAPNHKQNAKRCSTLGTMVRAVRAKQALTNDSVSADCVVQYVMSARLLLPVSPRPAAPTSSGAWKGPPARCYDQTIWPPAMRDGSEAQKPD
jgi:hypothetical protein